MAQAEHFLHPSLRRTFCGIFAYLASNPLIPRGTNSVSPPLGAGWVIWREKTDLSEDLIFNVNYLGGNMLTFALNFSRPGGQIIAQYCNFIRLGKDGVETPFSLYDLADRLRVRGWQVPAYSIPAHREDLLVQRILVRHGVSRDLISLLLEDFNRCLEYFEKHPVSEPQTATEAEGFHH